MVTWEDPPMPQGGGERYGVWREEALALRDNPKRWALLATYAEKQPGRHLASAINRGLLIAFRPKGAFEARSRLIDGEYRIYARYLGEKS